MTANALRLSQLSPERRALVRLCQTINHGSIEDLEVRRSEPVFDPLPVMLKDMKLDADEEFRRESALNDFVVTDHVNRLCRLLDKMADGPRRSPELTHFCSFRVTHTKNTPCPGAKIPPAISSTP